MVCNFTLRNIKQGWHASVVFSTVASQVAGPSPDPLVGQVPLCVWVCMFSPGVGFLWVVRLPLNWLWTKQSLRDCSVKARLTSGCEGPGEPSFKVSYPLLTPSFKCLLAPDLCSSLRLLILELTLRLWTQEWYSSWGSGYSSFWVPRPPGGFQ